MTAVAGLMMLAAAFVGALDSVGLLHTASTTSPNTADQTGRRFIGPEALNERNTTR